MLCLIAWNWILGKIISNSNTEARIPYYQATFYTSSDLSRYKYPRIARKLTVSTFELGIYKTHAITKQVIEQQSIDQR